MYKIVKANGRKAFNRTFDNYEAARSYARKQLRKKGYAGDYSWLFYSNPSISFYGLSIKPV